MLDAHGAAADVVEAVEAELDVLVASVADRVMARVQAADGESSAALHEALRRSVTSGARDALARVRSQAELPEQLLPDLSELARLCATLRFDLTGLADA